jgi:hypothetical protein
LLVKKIISDNSIDFYVLATAHGQFVSKKNIISNIWDLYFTLSSKDFKFTIIDLNINTSFWKPLTLVPNSLLYEKAGRL